MKRILKYPLRATRTPLLWDHYAEFVHVGEQDGVIHLWASVDYDRPLKATVTFRLVMTGEEYSEPMRHLKTVQMQNGIVVHVFRELPP